MNNAAYNRSILEWEQFPSCDMVWTDPPWEQRALQMFQTMMRKDTGKIQNDRIEDLISKLATCTPSRIPVFIEYSVKGHELVIELMQTRGGHFFNQAVMSTQANGKPFMILSFNNTYNFPGNMKGFENIRHAIDVFKPQVIFDPFAGIGQTARMVIKCGVTYIGSEVNPARYSQLKKVTG